MTGLKSADAALYERYKADKPSTFLNIASTSTYGLDGIKLGAIQERLKDARTILETGKYVPPAAEALASMSPKEREAADKKIVEMKELEGKLSVAGALKEGGNNDAQAPYLVLSADERKVLDASIEGDRKTLKWDSFIPAAMAAIYLLLFLYFKTIGGYKPVHFAEELTGGTIGPMEA